MSDLDSAIEALNRGGLIAYPTEGVYGLGCDPLNELTVLELLLLKKRKVNKGLLLIAANLEQISPYIAPIPPECMQRVLDTWPGPVTWVFPASELVPAWIRGDHSTVGVRITDHPVAKNLCEAFGRPLVSTSANLEGEAPAKHVKEVKQRFPLGLEVVMPGKVGKLDKPTQIRDAMSGQVIRQ